MSHDATREPDRSPRDSARAGEPDPSAQAGDIMNAVHSVCTTRGLSTAGIRLLHHYSNAVVLLPSHGAVARVASGRHDVAQIRRSQDVTRWLLDHHGFGATRPLPGVDLVEVDATTTVSFWVNYPQPVPLRPLTSAHMGCLLADLHTIPDPPRDLPRWVPLVSLDHALRDSTAAVALDAADRSWLRHRISEVREQLATLDWPLGHGLIHGDAWAGNLLWAADDQAGERVVLGDWDRVAYGPREVDLIPTWHAARRYGKGPGWADDFSHHYGYDLTTWSGFPTLLAMRDLVQISGPLRRALHSPPHARVLRQRVSGLRSGDTHTIWTAL